MNLKTPCVGLFALVCACTSAPWNTDRPRVDDSLLVHVPESSQAEITDARTRWLELRDQLAAAEADQREADRLVEMSRRNLDTLESRASTARVGITHAHDHRTNPELDEARRQAEEMDAAVRFAAEQTRYQENLAALADERTELLKARIALADAKVELAKARAVVGLDRPAVDDVHVEDHHRAVAELSREVEHERIDALVARARVDLQKQYVDEGRDAVPETLRLQTVQAIDSVFEARAFERHDWDLAADYRDAVRRRGVTDPDRPGRSG